MDLLKELNEEHRLIEEAAGSMVTLARMIVEGDKEELRKDFLSLCRFLSEFVADYHSKKEEKVLFQAFGRTGIPMETGPIYYYELEHKQHEEYAGRLKELLSQKDLTGETADELLKLSVQFCGELWEHIDKEDSVLFEEVVDRIKGKDLRILTEDLSSYHEAGDKNPEFNPKELMQIARDIISRYKPIHDLPDVFRGDGCMSCRHYGAGCRGIEHEWWTENEWEDFYARNNRD